MGFKEFLLDKLKRLGKKEPEEPYVPRQVEDRYLDSLRRERQVQLNELEKANLKKKIAEYRKKQLQRHVFGITEKSAKIKKSKNMLSENDSWLGRGKLV